MFCLCDIMASVRYRSFLLGIVVTSATWVVIIFLYFRPGNLNSDSSLERSVKWKLRPRINNMHRIAEMDNVVSTEAKSKALKENSVFKKLQFPPRELNLIDSIDTNDVQTGERTSYLNSNENILNSSSLLHLGMIRSPKDQRVKDEGYKKHAFNLLISDRLGHHRPVPYTAHSQCKKQIYSSDLPLASVVICFYNEAWSTLLRTVYSLIDRTPENLLHEIILIDDYSDDEEFREKLKHYIRENAGGEKIKVLRTPERAGLIRARVFGAKQATGKVLVFLDSHCEVNERWLEPLLQRISENRTNVVCPIIDIINADTFEYVSSPIVRGGFNWGLHFKWDSVQPNLLRQKEDFVKPILSPTMAGGLFAMDKAYFHELGEYDPGMDIWGGENLEISFRIWMCGGRLEIIPCSRVGHVFRRRRPYGSPNGEDTLTHNSLRVAHVWMDEYKENYFIIRPDAREKPYGDISERVALRKHLQCKSFDWYMKNIYPEISPPQAKSDKAKKKAELFKLQKNAPEWKPAPPAILYRFQIRLTDTNLCIESEDDVTTKGSLLILQKCSSLKRQMWYETEKHDIRLAQLLCLDAGERYPRLSKCHEMGGSQDWRHADAKRTPIYNTAAGLCLGSESVSAGKYITLTMCSQPGARKWDLVMKPLL